MSDLAMFRLDQKKAIVTGAAKGIGKDLALGLAKAGVDVAVVDTDLAGAQSISAKIKDLGREAIAIRADVSLSSDVNAMVRTVVKEFGRVDILVNNAGINVQMPAEEYEETSWNRVLAVNLTGVFLCSQAAGREMIKQGGGSIINMSSLCAVMSVKNNYQCAYYASKAGVSMLTKALAVEWAKHNIRVNAIAPGVTSTPLTEAGREKLGDRQVLLDLIPMGRIQLPKELVGAVIFLSSDASSYVTGHILSSDGGITL